MNKNSCILHGCDIYDSDYETFVHGAILIEDGKFARVMRTDDISLFPEGVKKIDMTGKYVIPGLVDVHTHGRAGYDFNTAPAEKYDEIALSYARTGTTTLMPTLASATLESLECSTAAIAARKNIPGTAAFAGVHLEGRYLSPKKRGAHAPEFLSDPSAAEIRRFREIAPDTRMRLSMAPELPGGDDMIRAARELGVVVTAAHTDADFAQLSHAVALGVTGFTHTFNAMRPIHHRDPGGAGAALLFDECYAEFICDGHHIAPEIIKLSWRAKVPDRFVLITDSMEAAGCPDGEYSIAGLPVFVRDGLAVNNEGALAGSTLDLFTALKNFMKFCGLSLEEALPSATSNPARMIGAADECGSIREGARADFIVISDKDDPVIESVVAAGKTVEL